MPCSNFTNPTDLHKKGEQTGLPELRFGMKKKPFIRGKKGWHNPVPEPEAQAQPATVAAQPKILRKHATTLPINARVARIQPGRVLLIPDKGDLEREALAEVWQRAGGEVRRIGRFWEPTPGLSNKSVCLYGNDIFCQVLAEQLELELVSPRDDLLVTLSDKLLGRNLSLSYLSLIGELGFPCFVKPLQPKLFAAGIFDSREDLADKTRGLEPGTGLIVSEVVEFQAEARAFIYDRKVLDCALYSGKGALEPALELAAEVAQLEDTPFGFVVDLGLFPNGRWVVVEFNPAWGAGLNGCDADRVLSAIATATRAR